MQHADTCMDTWVAEEVHDLNHQSPVGLALLWIQGCLWQCSSVFQNPLNIAVFSGHVQNSPKQSKTVQNSPTPCPFELQITVHPC